MTEQYDKENPFDLTLEQREAMNKETQPEPDVRTQPHYANLEIEPIDVILKNFSPPERLGYLRGNVTKYIMRCQYKPAPEATKDMEKAKVYLSWLIDEMRTLLGKSSSAAQVAEALRQKAEQEARQRSNEAAQQLEVDRNLPHTQVILPGAVKDSTNSTTVYNLYGPGDVHHLVSYEQASRITGYKEGFFANIAGNPRRLPDRHKVGRRYFFKLEEFNVWWERWQLEGHRRPFRQHRRRRGNVPHVHADND